MMGTFGGALEARQIDASNGKLTAEVTGEVETEEGVLVIRRIHVAMRLVASEAARETVERTHGIYAEGVGRPGRKKRLLCRREQREMCVPLDGTVCPVIAGLLGESLTETF